MNFKFTLRYHERRLSLSYEEEAQPHEGTLDQLLDIIRTKVAERVGAEAEREIERLESEQRRNEEQLDEVKKIRGQTGTSE